MNITFTWERGKIKDIESKYFLQSQHGYRVSKCFYKDEANYTAWTPIPREILKVCNTSDDAKAACELHYMENMK